MDSNGGSNRVQQLFKELNDGIDLPAINQFLDQLPTGELGETAKSAVRSIHRKLQGFRTKESVLRALFDTATDLTSIHDAGEIMATVVKRTRTVMGSDMAYLSLNDFDSGTTYIRETEGVATQAYRDIRMPFGYGILGSVAHANGPYQTSDYDNDDSMMHIPEIDEAVQQEGVKSILGAPLRNGGRVIGALMVADRSSRKFTPDEVDAIESLASHAAVVFENARLFNNLHENLAQLETAAQQSRSYVAELEAIADAEQQLLGTLTASDGLANFTQVLTSLLKLPLQVVELLPGRPLPQVAWLSPTEAQDALVGSAASGEPVATMTSQSRQGAAATVTTMSTVLGDGCVGVAFVLGELDTAATSILKRSAVTLAALLSFQRSLREIDVREQSEIVEDLVSDRPGRNLETLERRTASFGLDLKEANFVAVIDVGPTSIALARSILVRQLRGTGIVSLHSGHVCAVVGLETSEETSRGLLSALERSGLEATVSYSDTVPGLDSIPERHSLTVSISAALRALGRTGEVAGRATIGAAGLIVGRAPHDLSLEIVHSILGRVIDYDQLHGSDLVSTIVAFFDSNMNIPSAAKQLHVHANTIRQRLERVDQLLGPDWRRGTRVLDGHLAARIWQLQRKTTA